MGVGKYSPTVSRSYSQDKDWFEKNGGGFGNGLMPESQFDNQGYDSYGYSGYTELDRAGYFIQLQVHDETDGTFGSVAEAKAAGKIMMDCVKDRCTPYVPFNVDTETGPSWGEISK